MTNLKIKQINITAYRVIASFIVVLPVAISYSSQWSIALSFMVFPLLSLLLAAIAKYIDFQLVKSMFITAKQDLANNIERSLENSVETSIESMLENKVSQTTIKTKEIQLKAKQQAA